MGISKMKFLLFVVCLLTLAQASKSATHQKIERVYQTKGWGQTLLKMAELHMQNKGPVDDLIVAIDDVTKDLEVKLERAHDAFGVRTEQHDAEVSRLNGAILKAKTDISSAQDDLKEVMFPLVKHLQQKLAEDKQLIVDTKAEIGVRTNQRQKEHEEFGQKIQDLQAAIDVFQQVIDTLQALVAGELVQVKASEILKKAHAKIMKFKNVDLTIAKTLAQLATSQEFTDQSALRRVMNMILDSQSNLKLSQVNLTAEEKAALETFKQFVSDSKAIISGATSRIYDNTALLQQTLENIEQTQAFIKTRQFDQAGFEKELEEENASYIAYTERYNALVEELEKEIAGVAMARNIITSGEFAGYIADRINSAGTKPMKQQGSGVEVFQSYEGVGVQA